MNQLVFYLQKFQNGHFVFTIFGPYSSNISFVICSLRKLERDEKMDPPIQFKYFLSGRAITLTLVELSNFFEISFSILFLKPGNNVPPPERTTLENKILLKSLSFLDTEKKIES